MKKFLLISGLVCLFALTDLSAQHYKTGIGFRFNSYNSGGLTVKHFISGSSALEGIFTSPWGRGWNLTGLYEIEKSISDVDGLAWFFGFGGHLGMWPADYAPWKYNGWVPPGSSYMVIGADGILGLEFTIPNAPITFQLDWKPAFNIIGYTGFWPNNGGISVRYAIK